MIRDDYILRQIRMLAQIVARLLGLRRAAQHEAALAETEQALHRLLGMGSGLAAGLAPEEVAAELCRDAPPEAGRMRIALLAALLYERAANLAALGREAEGRVFQLQALRVLLTLPAAPAGEDSIPRLEGVPNLEALASGVHAEDLPPPVQVGLMRALERDGAFGRAEDLLFEMRAARPDAREIVALGEDFYARLDARSDAALEAGNLPRAEIDAGRAALRRDPPGAS